MSAKKKLTKETKESPLKKQKLNIARPEVQIKYDQKFIIKKKEFKQQFSQAYYSRLQGMRKRVQATALKQFSTIKVLDKILDLKEDEESIIIGTLYKEMKLKPNILEDFEKGVSVSTQELRTNFLGDDDFVILEDEYGRIRLVLTPEEVKDKVTGIVCGVIGKMNKEGEFVVINFVHPGVPPQAPVTLPKKDSYVAIISGIDHGNTKNSPLFINLFFQFLNGLLGSEDDERFTSNLVHLVFAGNTFAPSKNSNSKNIDVRGSLKATKQESITKQLKEIDELVSTCSKFISIDIMPGENDPCNPSLPQQPIHRCLLNQSSDQSSLKRVTNPHQFTIEGIDFLGVSGETVNDIKRYTTKNSTLDIMEETLEWSHLSPTSPDSLNSYPFCEKDPFIIEKSPHVYFMGNQDKFETKIVDKQKAKVTIISIPKFSETNSFVLVNLKNLTAQEVVIKV